LVLAAAANGRRRLARDDFGHYPANISYPVYLLQRPDGKQIHNFVEDVFYTIFTAL